MLALNGPLGCGWLRCVSRQFACGLVEGRSWFASAWGCAVARPSVLLFLDRQFFGFASMRRVAMRRVAEGRRDVAVILRVWTREAIAFYISPLPI
mgnify:CR=1 FL=1